MHSKLPEPTDDKLLYVTSVRGAAVEASAWVGYVVAEDINDAEAIVTEAVTDPSNDVDLGIQGIDAIEAVGQVDWQKLEARFHNPGRPNEVLFRDGDTVEQVEQASLGGPTDG